jgi:hypothetical protein
MIVISIIKHTLHLIANFTFDNIRYKQKLFIKRFKAGAIAIKQYKNCIGPDKPYLISKTNVRMLSGILPPKQSKDIVFAKLTPLGV